MFNAFLGARVEKTGEGTAVARLTLEPHHCNQRGVAHGGVVSSLLDTVMGSAVIASIPKEWWCATTALSLQFLAGAQLGEVVAEGRVIRRGKSVAFVQGELKDAAGKLLATAQGSWHLWPCRPGSGERPPGTDSPAFVALPSGERLRVGKIVAVGRNYSDHIREMGNAPSSAPVLFLKPPSALVHDGGEILLPGNVGEIHHEVELVAVIGSPGRRIAATQALEHVLGYAVGLDLTLRDLQAAAKAKGEPWAVSKGFDTSAGISSMTARDEVGDGTGLGIRLTIGSTVRQQASTSQMLHTVAELVSEVSRFMTLERGDLLYTGTPAGVGPIRPGDRLEATIEKVGTLRLTAKDTP